MRDYFYSMKIEVLKGDITKLKVEAIANPANSRMTMGGGLSGIIRKVGGEEIRKEAQKFAPVSVGNAIVTGAGRLPCKFVIHAPTMERPAEKITSENTRLAMKAILECAEQQNIREIAVPGLGTGVGGVPYEEAAKVMVKTIKNSQTKMIQKIILVAYDECLYETFKRATKSF